MSIYIFLVIWLQSERGGHTLVLETSDKQQLRANLSSPPVSYGTSCTATKQLNVPDVYAINCDLCRIRLIGLTKYIPYTV